MKRMQVIKVKDYQEAWINRLAVVVDRFEKMETAKERRLAIDWLLSKYSKDSPCQGPNSK